MKCKECGLNGDKNWNKDLIEAVGLCRTCYADKQPLVKMPNNSYLPWADVNFIRVTKGKITHELEIIEKEDTLPVHEGNNDRKIPKILFCDDYNKWKIEYYGTNGELGNYQATCVVRYYNNLFELLKTMGITYMKVSK